ncbi:MAG: tetratricopeptide repeat protein [Anaerolineales bacterium]|nr:tetratricopeptide repeat protein [Anaerolineales bacterium]MCB9126659.1 tetratricopeptide repeat protein [Ardenticatenales bacterium]
MITPIRFMREGLNRLRRIVRPRHPVSRLMRAQKAINRREWGRAFDLSSQLIDSEGEMPLAFLFRAIARLHLDDYDGAQRDIQQCLSQSSEPPPLAYYWRGWLYAHRGEAALAIADFERVLAKHPQDPNLHFWLARSHWQRGNLPQMSHHLDTLLTLRPRTAEIVELEAHRAAHAGESERAVDLYDHALALGGNSTTLHFYRGQIRRRLGQLAAARSDLDLVLSREPTLLPARLERATVALDEGDYAVALDHAQQALALDNQSFKAHMGELLALLGLGHAHRARCRLRWLRDQFPPHALVEKLTGDMAMESEAFEQAAQCYQRALQLDPSDRSVALKLAGAWIGAERFEAASTLLAREVAANPDDIDVLATRADLYRQSDRPHEMRADLDRILQQAPDHAWALAYRAVHRHWQGDIAGAWRDLDDALDAEQGEAWIWAFRGHFHRRHGRFNAACSDFRHAITLQPSDPWIRCQWAALLRDEGQYQRAAEVLDRLIADAPQDGYARLARLELHLLTEHWEAARHHAQMLIEQEHELAWLAHMVAAVLSSGDARAYHLAQSDAALVKPTFWGYSPALAASHQALLHQLHGRQRLALAALRGAEGELRPAEQLWIGLRPLFRLLNADDALALLSKDSAFKTAPVEALR